MVAVPDRCNCETVDVPQTTEPIAVGIVNVAHVGDRACNAARLG
jgi:hypothetical protein